MDENGKSVPPRGVYSFGHYLHCIGFVNTPYSMFKNVR
jgi:hypothetical protein